MILPVFQSFDFLAGYLTGNALPSRKSGVFSLGTGRGIIAVYFLREMF